MIVHVDARYFGLYLERNKPPEEDDYANEPWEYNIYNMGAAIQQLHRGQLRLEILYAAVMIEVDPTAHHQ